jgi:hypothetical protein
VETVEMKVLFLDHERQQLILLNWLLLTKTIEREKERERDEVKI